MWGDALLSTVPRAGLHERSPVHGTAPARRGRFDVSGLYRRSTFVTMWHSSPRTPVPPTENVPLQVWHSHHFVERPRSTGDRGIWGKWGSRNRRYGASEDPVNEHQSPEEAREQQLIDLLRDLVDELGPGRAAEQLRVDRKTLWRVLNTGRLTPRLMGTLERRERAAAGPDGARQRERTGALEQRVAALERELPARIDALRTEFESPTSAQAEALRAWERRLSAVESRQPAPVSEPTTTGTPDHGRALPPPVKGVPQPVIGAQPQVRPPWRAHPEVITPEAEEGEGLVYGAATPLIVAWRRARAASLDRAKSRVERACGWVRMCELALILVGEHKLTLPPETYPWDKFRRERELWEQQQSLRDARWERRRALCWRWLRRLLTFGLWRR